VSWLSWFGGSGSKGWKKLSASRFHANEMFPRQRFFAAGDQVAASGRLERMTRRTWLAVKYLQRWPRPESNQRTRFRKPLD
jgi:hypothetical protein